jgi:hypothetical protein
MNFLWAGILVIFILAAFLLAMWLVGQVAASGLLVKKTGNNALDALVADQNWRAIDSSGATVPYVFQVSPTSATSAGQAQVSFYDGAGALKGFDSFATNIAAIDLNTIRLDLVSTAANYSQLSPGFPWFLRLISPTELQLQTTTAVTILTKFG